VQSVKRCLKKTIGHITLTFEELRTARSLPLTYIYDDAEGIFHCLTPPDLIYTSSNILYQVRDTLKLPAQASR